MGKNKEEQAADLWDEGYSVDEIADMINCKPKSVRIYLKRVGVEIDDYPLSPDSKRAAFFKVEWESTTELVLGGKKR
jgi:uncharacterized protein YjcR